MDRILRFKVVSSTQDVARRFIPRRTELAVIALQQRKGRGRHRRPWHSPAGGLYLSLLLFPGSTAQLLPLVAAVGVIRALERSRVRGLHILWPNDILVGDKKICGILAEQHQDAVVCGIGINVNIKRFPAGMEHVTSLWLEFGRKFAIPALGDSVLREIETVYSRARAGKFLPSDASRYITGIGEPATIMTQRGSVAGTVFGIDDDWALLLRDEAGVIRRYTYGQVRRMQW